MKKLGTILLGLALLAAAASQAAIAEPAPVLTDPTGDASWTMVYPSPRGIPVPEQLEFLRSTRPQNYSAVDVQALTFAENDTHVILDLDLVDLPPRAIECSVLPPLHSDIGDCGFWYNIEFDYVRRNDAFAPRVHFDLDVDCNYGCTEQADATVSTGSLLLDARVCAADPEHPFCANYANADDIAKPYPMTYERVEPDTLRFSLNKRWIRHHDQLFDRSLCDGQCGGDDLIVKPASTCAGDAFVNFHVDVQASDRGEVWADFWYRDVQDTADSTPWIVQYDSPSCPTAHDAASGADVKDAWWDWLWGYAGREPAIRPLDPARDAAFPRNGSAIDVRHVRIEETERAVVFEMELSEMPPVAEECASREGTNEPYCAYRYDVNASYLRWTDAWGPQVRVTWRIGCEPTCQEVAGMRIGDGPVHSGDGDLLTFDRVEPATARWTVDKAAFQRTDPDVAGEGFAGPSGPCAGDVFADVRFQTRAIEEAGANYYFDVDNAVNSSQAGEPRFDEPTRTWHGTVLRHDSAGCPPNGDVPGTGTDTDVAGGFLELGGSWNLAAVMVAAAAGIVLIRIRTRP